MHTQTSSNHLTGCRNEKWVKRLSPWVGGGDFRSAVRRVICPHANDCALGGVAWLPLRSRSVYTLPIQAFQPEGDHFPNIRDEYNSKPFAKKEHDFFYLRDICETGQDLLHPGVCPGIPVCGGGGASLGLVCLRAAHTPVGS